MDGIFNKFRHFNLTSIPDAPNPKSRMRNDGPRLWPIISHSLRSLSHRVRLCVYLVGWGGVGGGGGWFLGGGCQGGSGSSFP